MTSASKSQTKDAHARLAAIVESSDDAIVAKDLGGIVFAWNKTAERMFGYTAAEVIGQPITIIFPPDRLEEEAAILERIRHGEKVDHYETTRVCNDGRVIRVSVTISPIKDDDGTIVGASKIARDLTRRDARDRQIQELLAELAHVQRLTELGQVVSTLAHEVNQPLTAISNYAAACLRLATAASQERIRSAVHQIADQTDRARQIVQRIREFVKKDEAQMRAENLPQVIEEIIVLTHASVGGEGLRNSPSNSTQLHHQSR